MASRNEFQAIANQFHAELSLAESYADESQREVARKAVVNLIFSTADVFAQHNRAFDRDRFYRAAGLVRTRIGWITSLQAYRFERTD